MSYEISDGFEIPVGKKCQRLKLAQEIYDGGRVNKSVAAKVAINQLGLDGFASFQAGVDYIRHRLK